MTLTDTLAAALSENAAAPLLQELFAPTGLAGVDASTELALATDAASASAAIVAQASLFGKPVGIALVRASSGVVVAFDLAHGQRIVVKVHRRHTGSRLPGVLRAQRALVDAGLPVATALVDSPLPLGTGWATVETWHDIGETTDVRRPALRRAIATSLAVIVGSLDAAHFPELRPDPIGPYPSPHSPIFDFAATSSGAEWIDERNATALFDKARLTAVGEDRVVVVHTDLRPENVLVSTKPEPRVSAIYDLDSLVVDAEPWLVGGVARAFSTNWSQSDPMIPGPDEIVGFIRDYETVRGTRFTDDEWTLARAGVTHALAYSARCEHALFADGGPAPWGPGWRDLLRRWER